MRPELKKRNARLAKIRREKANHSSDVSKAFKEGIALGRAKASQHPESKLYRAEVVLDWQAMSLPFDERQKIAKKMLSEKLIDAVENHIDITVLGDGIRETWRAQLAIGGIKKVMFPYPF